MEIWQAIIIWLIGSIVFGALAGYFWQQAIRAGDVERLREAGKEFGAAMDSTFKITPRLNALSRWLDRL